MTEATATLTAEDLRCKYTALTTTTCLAGWSPAQRAREESRTHMDMLCWIFNLELMYSHTTGSRHGTWVDVLRECVGDSVKVTYRAFYLDDGIPFVPSEAEAKVLAEGLFER